MSRSASGSGSSPKNSNGTAGTLPPKAPPMGLGDHLHKFQWEPQPVAQKIVDRIVNDFLKHCHPAARLAKRMRDDSGTRFKDWVDHIRLPASAGLKAQLREVGFEVQPQPGASGNGPGAIEHYVNPKGIFPSVVLDPKVRYTRVALKVDSVAHFLATHHVPLDFEIQGEPGSQYRAACAFIEDDFQMWVVERHGYRGFEPTKGDATKAVAAMRHLEAFCRRPRNTEPGHIDRDDQGFAALNRLVDAAIKDLGRDWTCDLFFESERRYWMARNWAAQVQYVRQHKLGLGWANHDHHTYRSSREHFTKLIALWEKLGLQAREAFYAGAEAGWGAQVMESPVTNITTFNDVDMSPEELMEDFAHKGFKEKRAQLGTVGLWVALHGEAVLQAGMHHLECVFDFHALAEQLERNNHVKTMAPFTTFPFLRQAFTEGERWEVDPARIDALLAKGQINAAQAVEFRAYGAIGSHLENLERNDGFKGFNQKGVSDIIARTDPRKQKAATTLAGA